MSIKVSVIVATYNQEKYIRHTLESIVAQKTNFAFEVLVGDDCSTDGTAEIVNEFAEKYPDIIIPYLREKNLGIYGNIPELLTHAKGEFIAIIEGDDYWIDDYKLQKQADFLDKNKDYNACYGKCIIVDDDEVRHPEIEAYNIFKSDLGDYTIEEFEKYILPGQTATSMFRVLDYTEIMNKFQKANVDVSRMADIDMVLCMLGCGKTYNFGEEFAAYRRMMNIESGSWSSQNDYYSLKNLMQYLDGLKRMEKMAAALELKLNFDSRRDYELDKLYKNLNLFSREEIKAIKEKLKADYNAPSGFYISNFKLWIKSVMMD
ncbi:glycosyltransferase family 2 protein [Butyrivibrio sp. MB2005]|uniref:glycosyltransferase family 2 protein n=1 Tax=Butyrivibrio sp. MB2005 TaxID=1280678 RepID=UPI000420D5CD|nr:glycosyltransferase [Butyrivibrio sp. MB2005]